MSETISIPHGMRPVTEHEYYRHIGPIDVVGAIVGKYPYTTIHRLRNSLSETGRIVDAIPPGEALPVSYFFLT